MKSLSFMRALALVLPLSGCAAEQATDPGWEEDVSEEYVETTSPLEAAEAPVSRGPERSYGCQHRRHRLELVQIATTGDVLIVEARFHVGTMGALQHPRSAPRVTLLRDGCAARAPDVVGVVEAEDERRSSLRVPLAELPDGRLDLGFAVEGAELVLMLRKKGNQVVLETDADRYPDGNTDIGGAEPCGRVQ